MEDYKISHIPQPKGMLNNDFSIAIPSYKYVYDFLTERGIMIRRFTESERLNFSPFKNVEEI